MEPQEMVDLLHNAMKERMAALLQKEIADTDKYLAVVGPQLDQTDAALWRLMSGAGKMNVLTTGLKSYLVILEEKTRTLPAPTFSKDS